MVIEQFQNVGALARDCNDTRLRYDEACLTVISEEPVSFWSQYVDCEGCKLLEIAKIVSRSEIKLKTTSAVKYAITTSRGEICNGKFVYIHFSSLYSFIFAILALES